MAPRRRSRSVSPRISRRTLDVMSGGLDSASADAGLNACVTSSANSNGTTNESAAFAIAACSDTGSNPHTLHPETAAALHTVNSLDYSSLDYSSITLPDQHLTAEQVSNGLGLGHTTISESLECAPCLPPLSYAVPIPPGQFKLSYVSLASNCANAYTHSFCSILA
jgi:hypothetical protein